MFNRRQKFKMGKEIEMSKELKELLEYLTNFILIQKLINQSLLPTSQDYNDMKNEVTSRLKELYPDKTDQEISDMIKLNL